MAAVAKLYESNFWMKFKSVSMMAWMTVLFAKTLKSYLDYGKLDEPMSHWKKRIFWFLELVD